jgi:hypothetical protein
LTIESTALRTRARSVVWAVAADAQKAVSANTRKAIFIVSACDSGSGKRDDMDQ